MKNISLLFILFSLALLSSCRIPEAPKKVLSKAESFSPGYVKTGDTVTVLGINMTGSRVKVGGVSVDVVTSDDSFVQFVVSDDVQADTDADATNNIEVSFSDDSKHEFSFPLIVNYVIKPQDVNSWLSGTTQSAGEVLQGPNQLLIGDFDDAGIRNAERTDRFDGIRYDATVKEGGEAFVGMASGVLSSPAKGDYLAVIVPPESISLGASGFAAEVDTDSDNTNDKGLWVSNFSAYPNSPLEVPETQEDLDNIYLNFCVHLNGNPKGLLDPFIFNDNLALNKRFRNNSLRPASGDEPLAIGLNEWVWVSLPFSGFGANFGDPNQALNAETYKTINKIKLAYTQFDLRNNAEVAISQGVEIYVDHLVITQGAPFFGHIR